MLSHTSVVLLFVRAADGMTRLDWHSCAGSCLGKERKGLHSCLGTALAIQKTGPREAYWHPKLRCLLVATVGSWMQALPRRAVLGCLANLHLRWHAPLRVAVPHCCALRCMAHKLGLLQGREVEQGGTPRHVLPLLLFSLQAAARSKSAKI
eukprot:1155358-Pelagomonas_calceolata.AAC.9